METQILNENVPVWLGIIITMVGMFIYNAAMVFPKAKKFSELKISIWWAETQIRFCIASIVIAIVFYMSWYYNQLTAEHCFYLGIVGNLIVGRIIKSMDGQSK